MQDQDKTPSPWNEEIGSQEGACPSRGSLWKQLFQGLGARLSMLICVTLFLLLPRLQSLHLSQRVTEANSEGVSTAMLVYSKHPINVSWHPHRPIYALVVFAACSGIRTPLNLQDCCPKAVWRQRCLSLPYLDTSGPREETGSGADGLGWKLGPVAY